MAEGNDASRRKCFVIGQIGGDGSPERNDADWVLAGIVRPALEGEPFNYDVVRGDEGPPGQISIQIVEAILDADLIVADLTGYNANAFYELGIAHMAEKPVIHMMKKGNPLPFDNKDYRTLFWDRENPTDLNAAAEGLAKHAEAVDKPDFKVSNPITMARGVRNFSESADPQQRVIASLIGHRLLGQTPAFCPADAAVNEWQLNVMEYVRSWDEVKCLKYKANLAISNIGKFVFTLVTYRLSCQ